jgi:hypothetical protein
MAFGIESTNQRIRNFEIDCNQPRFQKNKAEPKSPTLLLSVMVAGSLPHFATEAHKTDDARTKQP